MSCFGGGSFELGFVRLITPYAPYPDERRFAGNLSRGPATSLCNQVLSFYRFIFGFTRVALFYLRVTTVEA